MKRAYTLIDRLSPAMVVSIVAVVVGLGGVAWAGVAASGSSPRVIHACVQHAEKGLTARELFLPLHGAACPKGETPISWGKIGPEGPQGPRGETGLQGPESRNVSVGAAGPEGPMGREGPEGRPGEPGREGRPGPYGPAGAEGPMGPEGREGREGRIGESGKEGPEGREGRIGQTGKEGPPGPTASAFGSASGATLSSAEYAIVAQKTIELSVTSVIDATASAYATASSSAEEAACGLYLEGKEIGLASHVTVLGAGDSVSMSVVGSTLYEGFGEKQPAAGPHTVELKCEQTHGTGTVKVVNPSLLTWASGE